MIPYLSPFSKVVARDLKKERGGKEDYFASKNNFPKDSAQIRTHFILGFIY